MTTPLSRTLERYHVTRPVLQLGAAGVVALAVLIAAVVALPRSATKVTSKSGGAGGGGSYGSGAAPAPGTQANVPGAGSAGLSPRSGAGGASSVAPGGSSYATSGAPGSAHVSSRFVPARAPGVTNTTIYVGVAFSSQSGAEDKAIGAAGAAPSYDYRDVYNAVANYANAHGGFAGRKIKPLFYDYNIATSDTNTQDQAACAFWTQDNKVFSFAGTDDILAACAERAGAVAIGAGATTSETFKKYPHLIDPDGIAFDRLGQVTVSGLDKAHYFAGKLGLVTWDDPTYRLALNKGYLPALTALHIKPTQIAYIMVPQQLQAVSDMTAAVSSAVAKFKSLGIDHVMIQDGPAGVWGGDGLTLEWFDQSRSQRYYPRYGMNPYNNPGAWQINDSTEMDKGLAVDSADYDASKDAGWRPNAFRQQCFKIEADAGFPISSSNPNDEAAAASTCDAVFFLQKVVNRMSLITSGNFIGAAEQLGTAMPSAEIYGTKLFPGRHDGGDELRSEEYLDSCKCLVYKGPPYYAD